MRTAFVLTTALALASPAAAHVSVAKSSPAAGAAVAAPAAITLEFSGKIEPKFSGFDLLKADGSKAPLVPAPASADGRTLSAKVGQKLTPGAYKVAWRIVSSDGHRMTGGYDFTVR